MKPGVSYVKQSNGVVTFSTFHRYVRLGMYPEDWGGEMKEGMEGQFGE
jgi:hypothetical protein